MYTIYKHLNNEEVIYIGKSKSLLHRQRQHSKNSEWFDEIDSIEYCTLNSKIEMDIIELYLINTLNPKHNKKDKREDKFGSVNVSELKWLEFDMSEIYVSEKINSLKKYSYEEFIYDNIKDATHVSCFIKNGYLSSKYDSGICGGLEAVKAINFENKIINTEYDNIYNFKDLILYKVYTEIVPNGCIDEAIVPVKIILNTDNKKYVLDKKTNNKYYNVTNSVSIRINYIEDLIPNKINNFNLF